MSLPRMRVQIIRDVILACPAIGTHLARRCNITPSLQRDDGLINKLVRLGLLRSEVDHSRKFSVHKEATVYYATEKGFRWAHRLTQLLKEVELE